MLIGFGSLAFIIGWMALGIIEAIKDSEEV